MQLFTQSLSISCSSLLNLGEPFVEGSPSVLDQFRTAEERVAKRLRELKPLVDEYHELERVAERLGMSRGADAPASEKERPASRRSSRRRGRGSKTGARSAASAGEEGGSAASAKTSAAAPPAPRVRASRSSADKGPGSNRSSRRQQDVLRLVKERPGITVSEIAKELGVDATGLYRPVHRLEQEGAISKQGPALQPSGR